MNAKQLCVVSIAVAAVFAAAAPIASATCDPAAMREAHASALTVVGRGVQCVVPTEMRGVVQHAKTVGLSWWGRWR